MHLLHELWIKIYTFHSLFQLKALLVTHRLGENVNVLSIIHYSLGQVLKDCFIMNRVQTVKFLIDKEWV